jgi:hypothetical protein
MQLISNRPLQGKYISSRIRELGKDRLTSYLEQKKSAGVDIERHINVFPSNLAFNGQSSNVNMRLSVAICFDRPGEASGRNHMPQINLVRTTARLYTSSYSYNNIKKSQISFTLHCVLVPKEFSIGAVRGLDRHI